MEAAGQPTTAGESHQNGTIQKSYMFQTETKHLKQYYLTHQSQLINRRVLFNNSVGTVRYFGTLKHDKKDKGEQMWIGIQWEEEGRGKHNGTISGYQYFKCAEKQGSMIKYQKIEFGYKIQTALFRRYFRAEEMHHAKDIYQTLKQYKKQLDNEQKNKQAHLQDKQTNQNSNLNSNQNSNENSNSISNPIPDGKTQTKMEILKKKIHKIEYDAQAYIGTIKKTKRIMIQFVGFDEIWTKINNLDKLQSISLAECRICDLGPAGHLNSLLPNLKQLSLQDNLISSWQQILQLGAQLPQLVQLSLTNNIIAQTEIPFEEMKWFNVIGSQQQVPLDQKKDLFKNLRCIILINTGLTWKSLFKMVYAFRFAHQFILCKNNLADTENIDQNKLCNFNEARFINLESTNQTSFEAVQKFSTLPYLQKLILNKNPIKQLGRKVTGFKKLKHISLQYCDIVKPVVLYQISQFKVLQSVNVKHNLVGQRMGNAYVRLRAVAQLPKLTTINGALLKKYERKDCQIYYLRESFREYFAFKKVPDYDYDYNDFLQYCTQHHPNIPNLIARYGNPYELYDQKKEIKQIMKEEVKVVENKKGTGMVNVKVQVKDLGTVEQKKLPLSWTLSSLKNFFSKTLKIPVGLQILTCFVQGTQEVGQSMQQDHKPLSFYNLKTGSKILVYRKPG